MKTSTIVWIIVAIIVIVGLIWWFAMPHSAGAPNNIPATTETATTTAATSSDQTTGAVPGDNLTLGENSNATVGTYLVAYNGMTLYTYAPDTPGVSTCTGACADAWPPYTVTSAANLVAETPIGGMIGTYARADGSLQVTYNGHPLYFYQGDANAGDTNGQGVGGVWYVAQP